MPLPGLTRRVLLAGLVSAPFAFAAPFWEKKPFSAWTEEEARELLVKSPWAVAFRLSLEWEKLPDRPITYRDVPGNTRGGLGNSTAPGGSPAGGIGAPMPKLPNDADVILRWASAKPVKEAKAVLLGGKDVAGSSEAQQALNSPDMDYVLEIFGLPAIVGHKGTQALEAATLRGTTLRSKTGKGVRPTTVHAEVQGLNMLVEIHFSRGTAFTVEDQTLECECDTGLFRFRRQFDLRKMKVADRLVL